MRVRADRVGLGQRRRGDAHARRRRTGSPARSSGSPTARTPTRSTSSRATARSISAYVVRRGAPGFRVTREEEKLGQHSSSTADLAFEETPSERLGPPGAGMRIALSTLDGGRIGIAAQAVGIAQAALDVAAAYAKERTAFGRPIARLPGDQHKLADMQTEIEAARALVLRAARAQGRRPPAHDRGRAGQALRQPRRAPLDRRGDPGPRRLRLHQGLPGRALLPRRQGDRDLRGHERDPAARHRTCASRRASE